MDLRNEIETIINNYKIPENFRYTIMEKNGEYRIRFYAIKEPYFCVYCSVENNDHLDVLRDTLGQL